MTLLSREISQFVLTFRMVFSVDCSLLGFDSPSKSRPGTAKRAQSLALSLPGSLVMVGTAIPIIHSCLTVIQYYPGRFRHHRNILAIL